ncbi:MAG: hypothetical protein BMS9Abin26_0949 [Gammaproteobacteria bacterium]|nr:MAG: hypothetical protein BMS9Abin26_0949 [Gammaproteobacteria bacterium]
MLAVAAKALAMGLLPGASISGQNGVMTNDSTAPCADGADDSISSDIIIASWGWDFTQWTPGFYPDDLPDDWRLAYYSNEFRVVVIPGETLAQADEESIEGWAEAVADDFDFLLDLPPWFIGGARQDPDAAMERLLNTLAPISEQVAGVILPAEPGMTELQPIVTGLAASFPVTLLFNEVPAGPLPELQTCEGRVLLGLNMTSSGRQTEQDWEAAHIGTLPADSLGMVVVECDAEKPRDLRQLRHIVEPCIRARSSYDPVYLVFKGEPPRLDDMKNAGVIAELC